MEGGARVRRGALVAALAVAAAAVAAALGLALRAPPAPEQPIDFSHRLHAGELGLRCQYCHPGVRRTAVAGVPALSVCMGCHLEAAAEKPQVQKLARLWRRRQPVAWRQVYDLPEFVRFGHGPHLRAGIGCASCHGPVVEMERIRRVRDLRMGWCMECHERRGAPIDCLTCHH